MTSKNDFPNFPNEFRDIIGWNLVGIEINVNNKKYLDSIFPDNKQKKTTKTQQNQKYIIVSGNGWKKRIGCVKRGWEKGGITVNVFRCHDCKKTHCECYFYHLIQKNQNGEYEGSSLWAAKEKGIKRHPLTEEQVENLINRNQFLEREYKRLSQITFYQQMEIKNLRINAQQLMGPQFSGFAQLEPFTSMFEDDDFNEDFEDSISQNSYGTKKSTKDTTNKELSTFDQYIDLLDNKKTSAINLLVSESEGKTNNFQFYLQVGNKLYFFEDGKLQNQEIFQLKKILCVVPFIIFGNSRKMHQKINQILKTKKNLNLETLEESKKGKTKLTFFKHKIGEIEKKLKIEQRETKKRLFYFKKWRTDNLIMSNLSEIERINTLGSTYLSAIEDQRITTKFFTKNGRKILEDCEKTDIEELVWYRGVLKGLISTGQLNFLSSDQNEYFEDQENFAMVKNCLKKLRINTCVIEKLNK